MVLRLLLLLSLFGVFTAAQAEADKCLLWELQGEHNKVYLLGSVHMMKSEDYPLDRCVDDAYDKAAALVVELNTLAVDPQKMSSKMRQLGILPQGQNLQSLLGPETQKLLSAYHPLPEGYQVMRPWLLGLTLVMQKAGELGYRADLGIDHYLLSKAQANKPILSLETIDLQLGVLSGDNDLEQELTLRLTLEQLPEMGEYIDEVRIAWKQGDADTIYQAIEQPKRENPQLAEQFYRQVTKRNIGMAEQIVEFLQGKENYLVVIGGGHLAGEEGILALLEEQGIEMEQQPKLGRSMLY